MVGVPLSYCKPTMASNRKPQFVRNVFSRQPNGAVAGTLDASVVQDKVRTSSVRVASAQPAAETKTTRTQGTGTKTLHSQNTPDPKRQRVLVALWVKPRVREELQRIAQTEGISLSSVGASLLEEAVQHSLSARYAPLLEPIIRHEIQNQMQGLSNRLAFLLARTAFATEQTRAIATNITRPPERRDRGDPENHPCDDKAIRSGESDPAKPGA
jgi:hypothetical protein